ncbi:aminotransferase class V-fold PLP-dependent enzyme [Streptomyces sp. NBC_01007]|nr:aminotransferase class V-fold PLP-dependent enzyme [Streptomyces sp. NBC_01007]WRZ95700.1 aminotransferase class V-fold PLP-dependent enzyme [Streptomyces sp. NBC_01007]
MNATTAPAPRRARTVHLNTAGRGRMPAAVRGVVADCAHREDRYGPHEVEEVYGDVLHGQVQARIGALLGVPAAGVEVVTGAAEAFAALVGTLRLGAGDRLWTTPYESAANLATLYALRARARCRLEVVPLRDNGDLDLRWVAEHIDDTVALVSVTHVPSALGIVNPVEAVGRILAPHRCLYAVDASYAVGQVPVDAGRTGCHLLTADGWRFLRGPDRAGLAYVAPRLRQAPRERDARPYPPAAENAAVVGLNEALAQHAAAGRGTDVRALQRQLRAAVEAVEDVEVIAPGQVQSGIFAFHHPGLPAAVLRRELAARGVVVWKTVAQEMPLHLPGRGIGTALRACVHLDNTAQDVARFAEALRETVGAQTARREAVSREAVLRRAVADGGHAVWPPRPAARPLRGEAGAAAPAASPGAALGPAAVGGHPAVPAARRHLSVVPSPP